MICLLETIEFRKGILFLRLKGTMLETDTNQFISYLYDLIEKEGIRYIALNLSSVSSIDKKTIQMIDDVDQRLRSKGGNLVLCGSNEKIDISLNTEQNVLKVNDELNVFSILQL